MEAISRPRKKRVGTGTEDDGECQSGTPEYHVASRRMRKVSGREGERGLGGHGGTGDVFQMTPDVVAINAFVLVVAVVVDSREAGHCSVIGVCRGSGSSQSG